MQISYYSYYIHIILLMFMATSFLCLPFLGYYINDIVHVFYRTGFNIITLTALGIEYHYFIVLSGVVAAVGFEPTPSKGLVP